MHDMARAKTTKHGADDTRVRGSRGERRALPNHLRADVLDRDDHRCAKCGRTSSLEVHHINLVATGGVDAMGNLLTLCRGCHREAPDDPIELFKWAARSLPPDMDSSRHLTKIALSVLLHRWGKQAQLAEAEALLDEVYEDLWTIARPVRDGSRSSEATMPEVLRFAKKHLGQDPGIEPSRRSRLPT
jgi:hypothetical protein